MRRIFFWPFDGWEVSNGASVVAEVYPSLWTRRFPKEGWDGDEQAAYAVAAWLQRADLSGSLTSHFNPPLTQEDANLRPLRAGYSGWFNLVLRAPPAIHQIPNYNYVWILSRLTSTSRVETAVTGLFSSLSHIRKEYRKFVSDRNDECET